MPTTRCNMDCEMCQRRAWSDGPGDMTPETFARIQVERFKHA